MLVPFYGTWHRFLSSIPIQLLQKNNLVLGCRFNATSETNQEWDGEKVVKVMRIRSDHFRWHHVDLEWVENDVEAWYLKK